MTKSFGVPDSSRATMTSLCFSSPYAPVLMAFPNTAQQGTPPYQQDTAMTWCLPRGGPFHWQRPTAMSLPPSQTPITPQDAEAACLLLALPTMAANQQLVPHQRMQQQQQVQQQQQQLGIPAAYYHRPGLLRHGVHPDPNVSPTAMVLSAASVSPSAPSPSAPSQHSPSRHSDSRGKHANVSGATHAGSSNDGNGNSNGSAASRPKFKTRQGREWPERCRKCHRKLRGDASGPKRMFCVKRWCCTGCAKQETRREQRRLKQQQQQQHNADTTVEEGIQAVVAAATAAVAAVRRESGEGEVGYGSGGDTGGSGSGSGNGRNDGGNTGDRSSNNIITDESVLPQSDIQHKQLPSDPPGQLVRAQPVRAQQTSAEQPERGGRGSR
eukprot:m.88664 g.88664  ORF g.88664 m.88664 type:complete len:382 (-) comp14951_c0_seq2:124-1269(-)